MSCCRWNPVRFRQEVEDERFNLVATMGEENAFTWLVMLDTWSQTSMNTPQLEERDRSRFGQRRHEGGGCAQWLGGLVGASHASQLERPALGLLLVVRGGKRWMECRFLQDQQPEWAVIKQFHRCCQLSTISGGGGTL